uniref:Cystatin domain-containing protein n=1 Tax=Iconisemion striatum TaxID=60296 RepID=A0A1A7YFG8_9TELE
MWKIGFPLLVALFAVGLGSFVGGPRDIDVNDEGVQNALNYAVAQYNRGSNDVYLHGVAKVIKAQSQLVAGMKYIITVEMARTSCRKSNADDQCPIQTDSNTAQPYTCTFTVWSRVWLNDIQLLEMKCE